MAWNNSVPLPAVLLLGPTGSGKTPLGDWLQRRGLQGRACHHFDFGARLRAVVQSTAGSSFTATEIQFVRQVLDSGTLLEDESFHLAAKILDCYILRDGVDQKDWLLMNGLPRHVGQAQALASRLDVQAVVVLQCSAQVVRERLRRNTGGDRKERADDSESLVTAKLAAFTARTQPLAAYYQEHGAQLIPVPVHVETQPEDMAVALDHWAACHEGEGEP